MPEPRVLIETVAAPSVNHAMAHNGLRFLHRFVVRLDQTSVPITGVGVDVQVIDTEGQVISRPWAAAIETFEPGQPESWDSPPISLDPQYLAQLEERTTAEIVVTVRTLTGVLGRSHTPIQVLAARQWLMQPEAPLRSLELLAAFVQPNHPSITTVVAEAARVLEETTRSGSLGVEHAGPERIDQIVAAVFEAMRRREIFYAAPPASWGIGQKVRTPADVIEDRLGTCLDLTVVLAAALEQIGINPVLWVARGHAFLGYWRRPGHGLPDAASEQISSAANAVDLKLMGVLESTMLTRERRPPKDVFRRASQAPLDGYFLGGSADLVGTVDVAMARMLNVLPVPARRLRADGVVEVVEYRPAQPDPAESVAPTASTASTAPTAPTTRRAAAPPPPPRVQAWKNALLDLTLRNRLLNLGYGVTQLGLLVPSEQLGTIADLLQDDRSISVRALDDLTGAITGQQAGDAYGLPGDVQRAMLLQRSTIYSTVAGPRHKDAMQRLRTRARTSWQETGANPLALTLGRLDWQLGDRRLSAPLLIAPVEIRGVVQPFKIDFDASGQITLNLSLMEKLRIEFGFTVPGLTGELPTRADGDGVDVDAVITLVREAIAAAELEFRVESEARLAILSFTGYLLWRDLDQHWESFLTQPLVRHLVVTPSEAFGSGATRAAAEDESAPDLDEVVAAVPILADGSQAEAIAAARAGESFVLEGPPGTGKSQTITNILADQMAHGRTVLFVAEKGAALDVVRARLGQVGLLPYALDLHDHNARPSEVRARLKSALGQQALPDAEGHQVAWSDTVSSARALSSYASRLHERNGAGLSLYTARNHQLARGEGEALTVGDALVTADPDRVATVRRAVADAEPLLSDLQPTDASGWGFVGAGPTDAPLDRDAVGALVETADPAVRAALDALGGCSPRTATLLGLARTDTELADLVWLLDPALPDGDAFADLATQRHRADRDDLRQRVAQLRGQAAALLTRFEPAVITVPVEPVRQAVREAAASFFLGRKGRLVRAAAPVLAWLRPGQDVPPTQLGPVVDEVAALATQVRGLVQALRRLPGGQALPAELNLLDDADLDRTTTAMAVAERAEDLLMALPPTRRSAVVEVRTADGALEPRLGQALGAAASALAAVFAVTRTTAADQQAYAGESGLLRAWDAGAADRRADAPQRYRLQQWTRVVQALAPLVDLLPEARWELLSGRVGRFEAEAALDRGIARAAVTERLTGGGFGSFDPTAQDRTVDRFVAASDRLRESLRTSLPTEILEQRPFAPGGFFGKVAALEREANRTRGGLSVRQLMVEFGPVVTAVTPCVLVSPDSLARFIPPGSIEFDLVVFDEASQIRVADAVGALGRARAFVVAGDSKQMPPWSFGELAADDAIATAAAATEDADDPDLEGDPDRQAAAEDYWVVPDEESILTECASAGVTRRWLSWHYRSRDETLITFSNAWYYDDRLSSFPAVPGQLQDTGLSFVRVDGHFIRSVSADDADGGDGGDGGRSDRRRLLRTNPAEAAAVVAEVLRRWRNGERSIGVVTFNIQQRHVIEQLLWDSGVEGVAESLVARGGEGLFVKNLENVQGDERDVILFSTGFSANAAGVLPLNFGPLNRSGGERRLNVAITRARRRIIVFSSFDPEDLRTEQTSSVGLKHLRAYLELAKYGVDALPADPSPAGHPTESPRAVGPVRSVAVDRHRDEIAAALTERGIEVRTAVGLSEFRVDLALTPAGAGTPALAVLLDSPTWARRRTTGDRDGLPQTVLRQLMGWPRVARVWLPDWLHDPDRVLATLAAELDLAAQTPRTVGEAQAQTVWQPFDPEQVETVSDGPLDPAADPGPAPEPEPDERDELDQPFVAYAPPAPLSKNVLDHAAHSSRAAARLATVITDVVDAEGPVSIERLARAVVSAFGMKRVVDVRLQQIRGLVPERLRRDAEDGFVWPDGRDPLTWEGFRRTAPGGLADRPLDDVALREIANAAAYVVTHAMGIDADELTKELVRVFGGSRVTAPLRTRIEAALALAVRLGLLGGSGSLYVPGPGRRHTQ